MIISVRWSSFQKNLKWWYHKNHRFDSYKVKFTCDLEIGLESHCLLSNKTVTMDLSRSKSFSRKWKNLKRVADVFPVLSIRGIRIFDFCDFTNSVQFSPSRWKSSTHIARSLLTSLSDRVFKISANPIFNESSIYSIHRCHEVLTSHSLE